MSNRHVRESGLDRPSAPPSGVYFRVMVSETDAQQRGEAPRVQVRCFACDRRLFDVFEVRRVADDGAAIPNVSLRLERKCPSCKRNNRGVVTASPGDPWIEGEGLDGAWTCPCGKVLGHVDPIRGRVKTSCCRCRTVVRPVAARAIAVASIPTRPVRDIPELGLLDDAPFAENAV